MLGLSILLVGCEKPTAPEAREIARNVTRKFEQGDVTAINAMFGRMGQPGYFRWTNLVQNRSMEVAQDGAAEMINGYVIEEVLIAPGGYGRPAMQRTLVGWPDNYEYAIYASIERNPGAFDRPGEERRYSAPYATLALHRPDTLDSWVAVNGQVHIADPIIDTDCGKQKEHPPYNYPLPDVRCEFALYEVLVRGQLMKRSDMADLVRRSTAERHSLLVMPQRVPGVRFMTTCPADPHRELEYHHLSCGRTILFWRDNAQYAPALGIDVSRFREHGPGWYTYVERYPGGQERLDNWNWRWTIHTADGQLVETDSSGSAFDRQPQRNLDDWMGNLPEARYSRRIQAIVPAQHIDPSASPYDVRILQLERAR